jgi:hypothetical protein
MLLRFPTRTRVIALAVVMVIATIFTGVLAQSAMALAGGQDCAGPACDDQIACGKPTQPQATSGPAARVSLVAVAASVATDLIEVHDRITPASQPVTRPASRPFSPSAPRSPPSA